MMFKNCSRICYCLYGVAVMVAVLMGRRSFVEAERDPEAYYPTERYQLYSDLSTESLSAANTLMYTEDTWNYPGENPVEKWSYFTLLQNVSGAENATIALNLTESTWDCYINHYEDYAWSDLTQYGYNFQEEFMALGWTESKWNGPEADYPETENTFWADLTDAEQAAAENICYFQATWDQLGMPDWKRFGGTGKDTSGSSSSPGLPPPSVARLLLQASLVALFVMYGFY